MWGFACNIRGFSHRREMRKRVSQSFRIICDNLRYLREISSLVVLCVFVGTLRRRRKRFIICRRPVNRRNGNFIQPHINRQLAAVMHPMVQRNTYIIQFFGRI